MLIYEKQPVGWQKTPFMPRSTVHPVFPFLKQECTLGKYYGTTVTAARCLQIKYIHKK